MLFDADTGKEVPKTQEININDFIVKDSKGNYYLSTRGMAVANRGVNLGPPVTSGQPDEVYRGPGAEIKTNPDWEPIGPADYQNIRSLGYKI